MNRSPSLILFAEVLATVTLTFGPMLFAAGDLMTL